MIYEFSKINFLFFKVELITVKMVPFVDWLIN